MPRLCLRGMGKSCKEGRAPCRNRNLSCSCHSHCMHASHASDLSSRAVQLDECEGASFPPAAWQHTAAAVVRRAAGKSTPAAQAGARAPHSGPLTLAGTGASRGHQGGAHRRLLRCGGPDCCSLPVHHRGEVPELLPGCHRLHAHVHAWLLLDAGCATSAAAWQVPALLAVGLEGCWGLVICAFALPLLTVVPGPGGKVIDDLPQAWRVRTCTAAYHARACMRLLNHAQCMPASAWRAVHSTGCRRTPARGAYLMGLPPD